MNIRYEYSGFISYILIFSLLKGAFHNMYDILHEIRKTIIIYISNRLVDLIINFILDVLS